MHVIVGGLADSSMLGLRPPVKPYRHDAVESESLIYEKSLGIGSQLQDRGLLQPPISPDPGQERAPTQIAHSGTLASARLFRWDVMEPSG